MIPDLDFTKLAERVKARKKLEEDRFARRDAARILLADFIKKVDKTGIQGTFPIDVPGGQVAYSSLYANRYDRLVYKANCRREWLSIRNIHDAGLLEQIVESLPTLLLKLEECA